MQDRTECRRCALFTSGQLTRQKLLGDRGARLAAGPRWLARPGEEASPWRAGPGSPAVGVWSQLNAVRGDLVGDGAGVAGHGGRVRVDLVEQEVQGAGDALRGGPLGGDGDRGGGRAGE